MLTYLKKYWYWCVLAPIFMLGEITMDLLQPDLMATIVDDGVLGRNMAVILSIGIRMILLVLFGGLCGFLSGWAANIAAQNFGNNLRKALFSRIMHLSFQQTDKISTGSLVTRLTNDVTQVQNMVMMSVRSVVRCSALFLGGIYMLYRQSPQFALITACGLPFVIFFVCFFMRKTSPMFAVVQKKLDGVNNVMQEDVAGARVVKAYVKEDYELGRFDAANDQLCHVNLRVQSLLAFMGPSMNIVLNLCVIGIILAGGISVKNNGAVTTGEIIAGITYVAMILNSIMFMANIFQTFTRAKASAVRIQEVLACDQIIKDGAAPLPPVHGELEFRHIGFSYPNSSGRAVLDDINLTVYHGETLAILGATGSGKTSLVSLIPRFYDATKGEVLLDGMNVKDYNLTQLRDRIAIVLQKTELYSRPIEANIRWGRKNASPWEIKKASEIAQADEFICGTPNGYYTQVAEGGHSLSGGQKQRISIARAVLKNAEILIFDDSTSALDLRTEANLYQTLREECPELTKIIIAQRIASVRGADRIAVLDGGRIAACGTHDELLESSAIYQDIFYSQLKKESKNNDRTEF
ncbi:MAG: ABC transporter ATP-binding protein [Clostridiaceae bacterium]|nr:ABC transporter ATP-binding protein [Clostridiaceae bacterium]